MLTKAELDIKIGTGRVRSSKHGENRKLRRTGREELSVNK